MDYQVSHESLSQQEEDAVAILIKSGHTD
jgi:hypothetical protein